MKFNPRTLRVHWVLWRRSEIDDGVSIHAPAVRRDNSWAGCSSTRFNPRTCGATNGIDGGMAITEV